ncbi:MAG: hypothetical protein DKM50_09785 [Candidatus Margulisiibacteriota bacterium]|nr:MAG: hypothetical protein A2X43_03880 [Candidatus Margulisbacteria bacterium GWD2_39_127]OGI01137.1 MAG: hypothetical protein A2X42_12055 [Candidatus Margulisbacteria bacterium GWF2_38_17]OGI10545.1 MAG: hypothetical protein A2X41_10880 [Candidatus Margulisbacteria bacterium GWE2_39_32]PZM78845.1 MAG: hypothetical protein DKM50_09785 [Candidatus Margulisiibacteriota bacterium]HAR64575.1 hypothetical protein [Candidatus Margulisiibacteriota bacterium]
MGFNIFDLLLPRETKFFKYMLQQIDCFIEGSEIFRELVSHIDTLSPEEIKNKLAAIKECEHRGDIIEMRIIDELNDTFITPLDREDIHTLAINIDRAMDILNSISRKIEIYKILKVPANVVKFSEVIVNIGQHMKTVMLQLEAKNDIDQTVASMHTLENEADELFHVCVAELFSLKYDPIDVIRFKEVYEHLESVVDSVDYVGKLVRGIKVKLG